MADFSADLVLLTTMDGYESSIATNFLKETAANGDFTFQVVSTDIPILIPTIRDNIPATTSSIVYFLMSGKDVDCGTVTYRVWVVTGLPDTFGAQYVGSKCGATALADVIVCHTWTV